MYRLELAELLRNGENCGVEFNRDDVPPEKFAKEVAALLNLDGGHVLLGVEDDGAVSGLTRPAGKAEEWVMEAARTHLRPAPIPYWETIEWEPGRIVGIVSLPEDAPDKPYKVKRGSAWVTQMRVGTTSRDATDDEEMRLYQQSGRWSARRSRTSICAGSCSTSATSGSRNIQRTRTPRAGSASSSTPS
jgi:ATP-dependent DNA helicase RecG